MTETGKPVIVPVRENHRLDEKALGIYLRDRLEGAESGISLRQFQGGQSNPTYLVTAGDRRYVLRKKPPGKLLPKAHAVEREYRVMDALHSTDVPVPAMRHLCLDPDIIGTEFYLMDYVDGRVLTSALLSEIGKVERSPVHQSLIDCMARLHQVDYEKVGLSDFGRPGNYVARQVATWAKQYEASKGDLSISEMDWLRDWLAEHVEVSDETAIAHGDFRLGNMIVAPDRPEIVAILDWELSTLGHPLADLGYYCLSYHLPNNEDGLRGLRGVDLAEYGIPDERSQVDRYCEMTGRDGIKNWPVFVALAAFRLAAILQGVAARAAQGNAANADAAQIGARAGLLAKAGKRVAQG